MPGVVSLENRDEDTDTGGDDSHTNGVKNDHVMGRLEVELDRSCWPPSFPFAYNNKLRKRVLISTTASFANVAILFLMKIPDIELRVISDDVLDLAQITREAACYADTPVPAQPGSKSNSRSWISVTGAELISWADVLILSPMAAGTLGAMLAGLTTSLTLTVLRGWDITKTVLLVPGMTLSEWQFPLTKRQLNDLASSWPWVRVLPPILSGYKPPTGLVEIPWDSWAMFGNEVGKCLGYSSIPISIQEDENLAKNNFSRDGRDLSTDRDKNAQQRNRELSHSKDTEICTNGLAKEKTILPPEILTMIFEILDDWETATSVGIYTKIPMPRKWKNYIPTSMKPSTVEYAVLRGSMKEIEQHLSKIPACKPLSILVTDLILKFSRTDILDYLRKSRMDLYLATPQLKNLPLSVSAKFGSTAILTWWQNCSALPTLPVKDYLPEAIDAASRAGFVHMLEWWRKSGLPFHYTERSLESASAEGRIAVLDWWKNTSKTAPPYDPVPLKVGKSVLLAAQTGRTDSLAWWTKSDIPFGHAEAVTRIASSHGHVPVLDFWYRQKREKLIFDNQVLVGATKNGHVDVLEWWKRSGLPVEFKTCDIEEALEDAVSGVEERVRLWWARNGLNLGVGTNEWMMVKSLN
ncbi:hypothetical protein PABG_01784 [Paracoccidioides brasiliensis Pb03]|nr:hypothetical protein PABG_01784 [Paracoccidioides brasiliensis Pb03]